MSSNVLDGVVIIFIPTPILFCAALALFLLSALFWLLFALWWRRAKSRLHRPALPSPHILPFSGRRSTTTYFAPKRKLAAISRKE